MWGTYVEGEIHEATKKAKNDAEAERKVALVMSRIFRGSESSDGESNDRPVKAAPNRFRDPGASLKAKG